jgi:hypothetical protein
MQEGKFVCINELQKPITTLSRNSAGLENDPNYSQPQINNNQQRQFTGVA